MRSNRIASFMTEILNKKITRPEDIPAVSWAETISCGGNKYKLEKLWKKSESKKKKILKQMKKEGKTTVEDYHETKRKLGL